MASSDLREHEGHQSTTHHDGIQNVPEISAVTAGVKDNAEINNLKVEDGNFALLIPY